ncbi:MAG: proline racemase family protein [Candidatus Bathyarchaeota archaeon]|nr:MAG: proline racemase family protein [Candidatus Bathyarchaeota archaeon]
MKFSRTISCIDTHSSGEATRVVVGGIPKLRGANMAEKQAYFQEHYDNLRPTMLKEPRGFAGLLGAVLTEPTDPEADIGVIYLWTDGYFSACGDSTYSVSAVLVNTGMVEVTELVTEITLDTVAGLVRSKVYVENGEAKSISMRGVPSFYTETVKIDVPDVGKVEADIAYGGLWYAFIDASSIGLEPSLENKDHWIPVGWKIRNYLADRVKVSHPEYPELNILDLVTFYTEPSVEGAHTRHWNVFGPKQSCRSPAGTCTNARMAALYGKGELKLGEELVAESTINTLHYGKIVEEAKVGEYDAIQPEVSATAYITAFNQIVIDPRDPQRGGFLF